MNYYSPEDQTVAFYHRNLLNPVDLLMIRENLLKNIISKRKKSRRIIMTRVNYFTLSIFNTDTPVETRSQLNNREAGGIARHKP